MKIKSLKKSCSFSQLTLYDINEKIKFYQIKLIYYRTLLHIKKLDKPHLIRESKCAIAQLNFIKSILEKKNT